jgi:hypothetical protein
MQFNVIEVLEGADVRLSVPPLSKDGSNTYIKDLNFVIQNLLNNVIKTGELDRYW